MADFLIVGAGRQGVACGTFLLERYGGVRVRYADRSPEQLEAAIAMAASGAAVSIQVCDVAGDDGSLERLMAVCDCVVSCVPFFLNERLARLAIQAGKHFCDLGGNIATVRRQLARGPQAQAAGVCVVPDCGLAPGTVNVLAELWRKHWQYRSVKILCGGLPEHPTGVLKYQANFSIHGLLNEYLDDCQVARGGKVVAVPGLSEVETVDGLAVPGRFEAFATSGGASLAPELYAAMGIDYEYKTIRYPGHRDAILGMAEIGMFDPRKLGDILTLRHQVGSQARLAEVVPRDVATMLLEQAFASDRQDFIVTQIQVRGQTAHGEPVGGQIDLVDRSDSRFTAMERTTGFSAAIVAAYLTGLLPGQPPPGAWVPSQVVPPSKLIDELKRAGMEIRTSPEAPEPLAD